MLKHVHQTCLFKLNAHKTIEWRSEQHTPKCALRFARIKFHNANRRLHENKTTIYNVHRHKLATAYPLEII